MGAGFGHTYEVYNNSYAALAFSYENGDLFESVEEYEADQLADFLRVDLKAITAIEVTYKGRVFDVEVGIESTYNGDDLCLVPSNIWDAYSRRIAEESTNSEAINWQAVAKHEDALQAAFELALCEVVFKEFPCMWVRQRIHGWCGTTYKPVADYFLDLKKQ